jgi:hypothetical protein
MTFQFGDEEAVAVVKVKVQPLTFALSTARARVKYRLVSFSFFKIEESSITLLRNAEILARTKVA